MKATKRIAARAGWALSAALLLVSIAGSARAQDAEPAQTKRWAVKLGAFMPTQGALRGEAGCVCLNVGVDYYPHMASRPLNGDVVFGADFYSSSKNGKSFTCVPLTVKLLWPISPAGAKMPVYGGLGTGLYFVNTGFSSGVTEPGLKVILGIDITDKIFAEFNYDYVSGFTNRLSEGLRADGLSVSAGMRF